MLDVEKDESTCCTDSLTHVVVPVLLLQACTSSTKCSCVGATIRAVANCIVGGSLCEAIRIMHGYNTERQQPVVDIFKMIQLNIFEILVTKSGSLFERVVSMFVICFYR